LIYTIIVILYSIKKTKALDGYLKFEFIRKNSIIVVKFLYIIYNQQNLIKLMK